MNGGSGGGARGVGNEVGGPMRFPINGEHFPLGGVKSLARNAAFLFSLRALQRLSGVAALYFVVRALDTSDFGEYQFILSWVSMSAVFALPGLSSSIMQSAARGFDGVYRRAVPRSFLFSLVGSALLAGFGFFYRSRGVVDMATGFAIAALLFPFVHGLEGWKALRSGKEDFFGVLKLDGLGAVASAGLMIAAVTLKPETLIVPICVLYGSITVLNVVVTSTTLKAIPLDAPAESGSLAYGTRITIYSAFNVAAKQADKLLIFFFLSPTALAIYYAAERIPELVKGLVQDVASVLAPRFAKRAEYTARMDKWLNIAGVVASVLMVGFAFTLLPWLIVLVLGEAYRDAAPYAQALMCSIAIANVNTLKYRYVSSRLDAASVRAVNVGMASTRIVASLVLIPLYGILGAVISAFIFRITLVIIVQTIIHKRYLNR